jgi:hypothetical protein
MLLRNRPALLTIRLLNSSKTTPKPVITARRRDYRAQGFTGVEVSTPEATLSTGEGTVTGTMAFDRKDYGMNSGIPFIKIADRVEVTVHLKGKRVSGPPLVFKE